MRIIVFLLILIALPSLVLAPAARTSVYVYDPPEVSANIIYNEPVMTCKWTITDMDPDDSHEVEVKWYRDSVHVPEFDSVSENKANVEYSASHEIESEAEKWECVVTATDSFNATANATASYYTPRKIELGAASPIIGFFSSILSSVTSFFAFWA